jgi:hypothetical protein
MAIKRIGYMSEEVDGKVAIRNSEGESVLSNDPKELLTFLARNYGDDSTINRKVSWDMDGFLSIILRRLGVPFCERLAEEPQREAYLHFDSGSIVFHDLAELPKRETGKRRELPEGYFDMYYYPDNQVGLQKGRAWPSYFYHLRQYWGDESVEPKTSQELVTLCEELEDAGFKLGLHSMMMMGSAISLFEDNCLKHMDIPTVADIDMSLPEKDCDTLIDWCNQWIGRGDWRTSYAVGHWREGESFDYDISSCYGYHLSRLDSLQYADFVKSKEPVKNADEGMMLGLVTINPDIRVSPVSHRSERGVTYPVACSWTDIIPLSMVRWLYRHKAGTFKLDEGIFWTYRDKVKPFLTPLNRIFDKRIEGGMVKRLAKQINSGCWGKLIQRRSRTGYIPFKNPVMAMQVKVGATLQVADWIHANNLQMNVLCIATDGVRTDKKVEGIPSTSGMGQWRFEGSDPCIIISPTGVITPTKKPQEFYYGQLVDLLKSNPYETYCDVKITRPMTMAEAVNNGVLEKTGEMTEFHRAIDFLSNQGAQDCDFDILPVNGQELLANKYIGEPPTISRKS